MFPRPCRLSTRISGLGSLRLRTSTDRAALFGEHLQQGGAVEELGAPRQAVRPGSLVGGLCLWEPGSRTKAGAWGGVADLPLSGYLG